MFVSLRVFQFCLSGAFPGNIPTIQVFKPTLLKTFLALYEIPIFSETFISTTEIWFFHERCSSSKIPRNFIEVFRWMTFPLMANIRSFKGMLSFWRNLWKNVHFVFPLFNDILLALNQRLSYSVLDSYY